MLGSVLLAVLRLIAWRVAWVFAVTRVLQSDDGFALLFSDGSARLVYGVADHAEDLTG
jgi:hypothetical protein